MAILTANNIGHTVTINEVAYQLNTAQVTSPWGSMFGWTLEVGGVLTPLRDQSGQPMGVDSGQSVYLGTDDLSDQLYYITSREQYDWKTQSISTIYQVNSVHVQSGTTFYLLETPSVAVAELFLSPGDTLVDASDQSAITALAAIDIKLLEDSNAAVSTVTNQSQGRELTFLKIETDGNTIVPMMMEQHGLRLLSTEGGSGEQKTIEAVIETENAFVVTIKGVSSWGGESNTYYQTYQVLKANGAVSDVHMDIQQLESFYNFDFNDDDNIGMETSKLGELSLSFKSEGLTALVHTENNQVHLRDGVGGYVSLQHCHVGDRNDFDGTVTQEVIAVAKLTGENVGKYAVVKLEGRSAEQSMSVMVYNGSGTQEMQQWYSSRDFQGDAAAVLSKVQATVEGKLKSLGVEFDINDDGIFGESYETLYSSTDDSLQLQQGASSKALQIVDGGEIYNLTDMWGQQVHVEFWIDPSTGQSYSPDNFVAVEPKLDGGYMLYNVRTEKDPTGATHTRNEAIPVTENGVLNWHATEPFDLAALELRLGQDLNDDTVVGFDTAEWQQVVTTADGKVVVNESAEGNYYITDSTTDVAVIFKLNEHVQFNLHNQMDPFMMMEMMGTFGAGSPSAAPGGSAPSGGFGFGFGPASSESQADADMVPRDHSPEHPVDTSAGGAPQGGPGQAGAPQGDPAQGGAPQGDPAQGGTVQGGAGQAGTPQGGTGQAGAPQGGAGQGGTDDPFVPGYQVGTTGVYPEEASPPSGVGQAGAPSGDTGGQATQPQMGFGQAQEYFADYQPDQGQAVSSDMVNAMFMNPSLAAGSENFNSENINSIMESMSVADMSSLTSSSAFGMASMMRPDDMVNMGSDQMTGMAVAMNPDQFKNMTGENFDAMFNGMGTQGMMAMDPEQHGGMLAAMDSSQMEAVGKDDLFAMAGGMNVGDFSYMGSDSAFGMFDTMGHDNVMALDQSHQAAMLGQFSGEHFAAMDQGQLTSMTGSFTKDEFASMGQGAISGMMQNMNMADMNMVQMAGMAAGMGFDDSMVTHMENAAYTMSQAEQADMKGQMAKMFEPPEIVAVDHDTTSYYLLINFPSGEGEQWAIAKDDTGSAQTIAWYDQYSFMREETESDRAWGGKDLNQDGEIGVPEVFMTFESQQTFGNDNFGANGNGQMMLGNTMFQGMENFMEFDDVQHVEHVGEFYTVFAKNGRAFTYNAAGNLIDSFKAQYTAEAATLDAAEDYRHPNYSEATSNIKSFGDSFWLNDGSEYVAAANQYGNPVDLATTVQETVLRVDVNKETAPVAYSITQKLLLSEVADKVSDTKSYLVTVVKETEIGGLYVTDTAISYSATAAVELEAPFDIDLNADGIKGHSLPTRVDTDTSAETANQLWVNDKGFVFFDVTDAGGTGGKAIINLVGVPIAFSDTGSGTSAVAIEKQVDSSYKLLQTVTSGDVAKSFLYTVSSAGIVIATSAAMKEVTADSRTMKEVFNQGEYEVEEPTFTSELTGTTSAITAYVAGDGVVAVKSASGQQTTLKHDGVAYPIAAVSDTVVAEVVKVSSASDGYTVIVKNTVSESEEVTFAVKNFNKDGELVTSKLFTSKTFDEKPLGYDADGDGELSSPTPEQADSLSATKAAANGITYTGKADLLVLPLTATANAYIGYGDAGTFTATKHEDKATDASGTTSGTWNWDFIADSGSITQPFQVHLPKESTTEVTTLNWKVTDQEGVSSELEQHDPDKTQLNHYKYSADNSNDQWVCFEITLQDNGPYDTNRTSGTYADPVQVSYETETKAVEEEEAAAVTDGTPATVTPISVSPVTYSDVSFFDYDEDGSITQKEVLDVATYFSVQKVVSEGNDKYISQYSADQQAAYGIPADETAAIAAVVAKLSSEETQEVYTDFISVLYSG